MQCIRTTFFFPFLFKTFNAFLISFIEAAPVERIIGFFFLEIFLSKGILVISEDEILKKGTKGFK
jgi:hypothetical protein